jgi:hypothetical protein
MEILIIVFALIGACVVYYSCYTSSGRDLSWTLLKFNPMLKLLFSQKESYFTFLKIFGGIVMAGFLFGSLATLLTLVKP